MIWALGILLVVSAGWARTDGVLTSELKGGQFSAELKPGFHFNEKAPNALTIDGQKHKPARLSAREAVFTDLPGEFKSGEATVYICDDASTFCEAKQLSLKKGAAATVSKPAAAKASGAVKVNAHGFIEDDFQAAAKRAQKSNRLLLVDFSARWCPGCVRLEKETFGTKAFKKMTAGMVKVKVDLDRFENGIIAKKYNVRAIPTLLILNSKQEEVDRVMDYQPMEILTPFFAAVKADPVSLAELSVKAKGGDDVLLRLGRRLLASGRAAESLPLLEKVQPPPSELLQARIEASHSKSEKAQVAALKAALKEEPASMRSMGWRVELVEKLKSKKEKASVRQAGIQLADSLLADEAKLAAATTSESPGEYSGFEKLLLAISRAELMEASAAPAAEIDAAWVRAGEIGSALKIPPDNTGVSIRHLSVLMRAKRLDEADRVSKAMLKADPSSAEVQRRRMRLLLEMKKYDQAIAVGRQVVKNSYGRNEFWAAEVLAKAYAESGRKKEALSLIDRYLARDEIGWSNMKDSRQTFEDLKKSLQL